MEIKYFDKEFVERTKNIVQTQCKDDFEYDEELLNKALHRPDPVVTELQHYAGKIYAIQPAADFNRHMVSTTPGVPYDLMCALLRRRG